MKWRRPGVDCPPVHQFEATVNSATHALLLISFANSGKHAVPPNVISWSLREDALLKTRRQAEKLCTSLAGACVDIWLDHFGKSMAR